MLRVATIATIVLMALVVIVWLGFLIPVRPFSVDPRAGEPPTQLRIPNGLPSPVERYLRAMSLDGETLPQFGAVTYAGTGWARPFGVWLPIRHRATVVPGRTMFRVMEFPWYGLTLLHVEDTYMHARGKTAISGLIEDEVAGPRTDQGAYLALAAESVISPSAAALGATWTEVDEHRARLAFPYQGETEHLLVTFDADTGLPARIEADRYKGEEGEKVGWRIELDDFDVLGVLRFPSRFEVSWTDESGPWSTWTIDEVVLYDEAPEEFGSR